MHGTKRTHARERGRVVLITHNSYLITLRHRSLLLEEREDRGFGLADPGAVDIHYAVEAPIRRWGRTSIEPAIYV